MRVQYRASTCWPHCSGWSWTLGRAVLGGVNLDSSWMWCGPGTRRVQPREDENSGVRVSKITSVLSDDVFWRIVSTDSSSAESCCSRGPDTELCPGGLKLLSGRKEKLSSNCRVSRWLLNSLQRVSLFWTGTWRSFWIPCPTWHHWRPWWHQNHCWKPGWH